MRAYSSSNIVNEGEAAAGAASDVLIVSAFGDDLSGGGLFVLDGSHVERIDRIATTGIAFDGKLFARTLRCPPADATLAEIAIYDERGVRRYLRLDAAAAAHDIAFDGDDIVVVSPWYNAVQWFAPTGEVVRELRYPGPRDSWHLNCITRRDGVWYATMFGDLGTFRAYTHTDRRGKGRIVNLSSGAIVAGGLTAPHTPRWVEDRWVVCNSEACEVVAIDEGSGKIVQRVDCGGWVRGLAYDDAFYYAGICRRRATQESFGESAIVVIDRQTWTVVDRIGLPAQEIYDFVFVPRAMLAGLRRGFNTNPRRSADFQQYGRLTELGTTLPRTLWPSGDPLPWGEFRCSIEGLIPPSCAAGDVIELPLRVTNRSASFFTSAPPAPVYASYKWLDPQTGTYLDDRRAHRTKLPRTLYPGETVEFTMLISALLEPQHALLRVTLMQEGVTWFDDHDVANAIEGAVDVLPIDRSPTRSLAPVTTEPA